MVAMSKLVGGGSSPTYSPGDLGQSVYTVTEGGTVTVSVLRTGNQQRTVTVDWAASGGNAGDLQGATAGTLIFPANVASLTFTLTARANTVVDGDRSVTITLG